MTDEATRRRCRDCQNEWVEDFTAPQIESSCDECGSSNLIPVGVEYV